MPPIGGQQANELLAAIEWLKPKEDNLWFRWQFFSCLPDWVQRQLVEDHRSVRELAVRAKDLMQKAPAAATNTFNAASEGVVEAAGSHTPKMKQWPKKRSGDSKGRLSIKGGQGISSTPKIQNTQWSKLGLCQSQVLLGQEGLQLRAALLLDRKLGHTVLLNAITAMMLVHITDQLMDRHYLAAAPSSGASFMRTCPSPSWGWTSSASTSSWWTWQRRHWWTPPLATSST